MPDCRDQSGKVVRNYSEGCVMKFIENLLRDEAGATAIEYGLIVALISVAAISAMTGLGSQLDDTFNTTSSSMAGG